MSYLSSKKSFIISLTALVVVGLGLQFVNWFIYPFSSAHPNFSDVESVYAKMQVPSTWTKKGEGANRGIAGRQCGIESDGCFSKVAAFEVPKSTGAEDIKSVLTGMGCISVVSDRTDQKGGTSYTDFECSTEGVKPWGTLKEEGVDGWSLSLGVSSR